MKTYGRSTNPTRRRLRSAIYRQRLTKAGRRAMAMRRTGLKSVPDSGAAGLDNARAGWMMYQSEDPLRS